MTFPVSCFHMPFTPFFFPLFLPFGFIPSLVTWVHPQVLADGVVRGPGFFCSFSSTPPQQVMASWDLQVLHMHSTFFQTWLFSLESERLDFLEQTLTHLCLFQILKCPEPFSAVGLQFCEWHQKIEMLFYFVFFFILAALWIIYEMNHLLLYLYFSSVQWGHEHILISRENFEGIIVGLHFPDQAGVWFNWEKPTQQTIPVANGSI